MNSAKQHLLHQLLRSGQTRGRNNFLRLTPCEFVAEHGWWYSPSLLPAHISRGDRNQCFTNAFSLAIQHPDLAYVEGYATAFDDGTRMAHAWLTDRQGNAIDVTWDRPGAAYAGVPMKLEFLGRRLGDQGEIGSMIDDFMNHWPLLRDVDLKPEEWLDEAGKGREKIVTGVSA
jgi:hypothetical protein